MVAPNAFHHLAIPSWQTAYPVAKTHAAPGLRKQRPDIAFDTNLGTGHNPDWGEQIDQVHFGDTLLMTELVFFSRGQRNGAVHGPSSA